VSVSAANIQHLIDAEAAKIPIDQPIAWKPTPKQFEFLSAGEDEVLLGGAAGPGKTDALVMDVVGVQHQAYDYPKYRGILFRRTFDDLTEIIDRSRLYYKQMFPSARYNESKHEWTWPSGAKIIFRYACHKKDVLSHWGKEYQYIGWDELTQQATEESYVFMLSRSRTTHTTLPCLIRATCTPNGPGHSWVKRRFQIPNDGKATCFSELVTFEDGHQEKIWRAFIPARLTDNPHLMHDRKYVMRLMQLGQRLRAALLEGRWDIIEGQFFDKFDPKKHIVPPFPIPVDWPHWRCLDWGYRKPYSVGWYTMNPEKEIYRYRELYGYGGAPNVGTRETAIQVARKIRKIENIEKSAGVEFRRNPADRSIWIQGGHGRGPDELSIGEIFASEKVKWIPASQGPRSRQSGWALLHSLLEDGKFFLFDGKCEHWLRTVPELQVSEDDVEDLDSDMEDHAADETRYSVVSRHKALIEEPQEERPKPGTFDHLVEITDKPKKRHPYKLGG